MSIATQIERLQGVRDQIRTKMVGLGLSSNTDLLQDLADDLDGVNKVSPTNNGATDPGSSYTNVDTLSRSTSTRYIKVPKGYNDADRKFTVSGVADGSVSTATTTDPGTDYTNQTTVTPSLDKQYVKLAAGYLPNSKITVNAIPNQKKSSDVSVGVSASISDITSIDTSQATSGVTVTASASGSVTVPLGYYSSAVTSDPTASDSTTIKPVLATSVTGSTPVPSTLPSGTVTITPNTDNTRRIYSDSTNKGFVTNIVLEAMASSSVSAGADPGTSYINKATVTPTTKSNQFVTITAGHLPNSKITVEAIPTQEFIIAKDAWSATDSAKETGSYTCTISGVTGVTASNDIVVLPNTTSEVAACGVYASAQGTLSITFKAFSKPSSNIRYTVYILNG